MSIPMTFRKVAFTVPMVIAAVSFAQPNGSLASPQTEAAASQQQSDESKAKPDAAQFQQDLEAFRQLIKDKGPADAELELKRWMENETEGSDRLIFAALSQLANHYAQANKMDETVELWQRGFDYFLAKVKNDENDNPVFAQYVGSAASAIAVYSQRSQTFKDQGPKILRQAIEQLLPLQNELTKPNSITSTTIRLVNQAHSMNPSAETEKYQEALSKLTDRWVENNADDVQSHAVLLEWKSANGETSEKLVELAQSFREKFPTDSTIMNLYVRRVIAAAGEMTDAEPRQARDLLSHLKSEVEKSDFLPEAGRKQHLTMIDRSLQRIGPALQRAELIGKPAPLFDAEAWVNGDAVTTQDLKGKVILLDFWAVWCGPCIATFPHLKEWNEAYADKGLVVIGVTSKYNYTWNQETQRAARGEEQSMDDEIAMLEKFLAHHELEHRSMVNPADSKMKSEYGVSGIPQAVLIDRDGIVRMIRVGSGEKNAKELHKMIEQLLAE